ncbi:hypothetical protein M9H77_05469 [Catharanthus roseus]|uniref:Uncharacterized protein n=1 Tax=Catharanthus roseus TaxID=4058 RepID=A0ACC0CH78_CATRO|nr:hypothetical protein M9H77_05469 [Catharanthus roseus]
MYSTCSIPISGSPCERKIIGAEQLSRTVSWTAPQLLLLLQDELRIGIEQVEYIHIHKTSAAFEACAVINAIIEGAPLKNFSLLYFAQRQKMRFWLSVDAALINQALDYGYMRTHSLEE